jgi:hypothetical protein
MRTHDVYTHKVHAHGMHARDMLTYDIHAYRVQAYETRACEVYTYEMHVWDTCMRCCYGEREELSAKPTPIPGSRHNKCTPMRCTPTEYIAMRCTPERFWRKRRSPTLQTVWLICRDLSCAKR